MGLSVTATPSGYSGPRHFRGFALLASGQAVGRAMTLVATVYLARVLGVEMFGALGFAVVVVSLVGQAGRWNPT